LGVAQGFAGWYFAVPYIYTTKRIVNKLTIKRTSWHFRLAEKFGWSESVKNPKRYEYGEPSWIPNDDFCSYLRRVLLALAVVGGCVALFVFYTYCNVLLFVDVMRHKFVFANGPIRQVFALCIDVVLLAVLIGRLLWKIWFDWGMGGWIMDLFLDWRDTRYAKRVAQGKIKTKPERDPFYRAAYDSLKHKFCMKIEVTND